MSKRLAELRAELKRQKIDAFIVPRQDEFQGEYVAAYAERLKWITGFSGSWGVAVIGQKTASVFVDGRYTLQVKQEVDGKAFQFHHLMRSPPAEWITRTFRKGARIGYDPRILSMADAKRYSSACENAKLKLVPVNRNPIDTIWKDQPSRPSSPIVDHPLKYAGQGVAQKLKAIRGSLKEQGADAVIIADPTSVAWAFNLRGNDVPFTPVALCYAMVPATGKAHLFVDGKRLSKAFLKTIKAHAICSGTDFDAVLTSLGKRKAKVMLDPIAAPDHFRLTLQKSGASVIEQPDPCMLPKAQKNKTEQQGARNAQLRDGAVLSNFLCWLENAAVSGKLSEGEAATKLLTFRQENKEFRDLSFESISAAGSNSALPHYHAHGNGRRLALNGIYLIDSGGQYPDGTTDVTRTVIIGEPSEEMRDRFTRVLKGMIAVSLIQFPEGTTGAHLDALARAALWKAGLDFDHGTGHGIGSYLSVHEGPQRISKTGNAALKPGMIISNEPGYYKTGHFGIRIENLLLVTDPQKLEGGERAMLGFETLTFAPIDRRLIATHLLTREELLWVDTYHAEVWSKLQDRVSAATKPWLKEACVPYSAHSGHVIPRGRKEFAPK
jgi:Xaa-Pro aminopeptidase